jgi:hypothetical protein
LRLATRFPARVAPCPRPRHDPPCLIYSGLVCFFHKRWVPNQPALAPLRSRHRVLGRLNRPCYQKRVPRAYTTGNMAAPALYVEVSGAELMAAPMIDSGAPAEGSAPTKNQRDEADNGGEDFVLGGQEKTPTSFGPFVPQAPVVQTCVSAGAPAPKLRPSTKLVEGTSPRGLAFHCTDKADLCTLPRSRSAELFFSCCVSVAALALANCNGHVDEALLPHPPTPDVLCTAQKLER